ncbi:F-box and WD repeat domain containing protein 10B-like isoform X1 [Dreissena polymorpha]|uniref:F-box and WD repeat domain containing protein 10B-like isoform X1 n=1 Tax=Dreissena polymorpha TaxID=45954 RepID=UPI0022648820|nr:F-box and WD repeat domain containing protein 10B-like isoform X1 [Dreissena polymorpha]XP_052263006.1 F-box and WD repeat domain containing protein 10B-like isoform X1 [Dreissena polymorpha]
MMLEVCRYSETSSVTSSCDDMMKHSAPNIEVFEFNLGQASQLRCNNTEKTTTCSECETCKLNVKLREIKQWFPRLGDHSKKRFMLGLMQRTHSPELLNQVVKLLQPVLYKDFTYSRSRTNPSLETDTPTLSSDRAMSAKDVNNFIISTWQWYGDQNYWSKSNFALVVLQMCDAHLLHTVGVQARTLLSSEIKAAEEFGDTAYTERGSIASSTFTFNTAEHPELDLLLSTNSNQEQINPFTGAPFPGFSLNGVIENDAGDEEYTDFGSESLDPAYMVIPTSAKAYSGVAKHCDLIRMLPVHISKQILSMLDKTSLMNALLVSSYWRSLIEEVHKDATVNQQLWEEVMLMQGASAHGSNPVYAKDIDILVPNIDHRTGHVIRTEEAVIKTTFKSEMNFDTAYSGLSVRKVIMEERNVYCGPYNVMVLCDSEDPHRVVHTDGGKLIAVGSKDRKVRFVDMVSGREHKRMSKGEPGADGELPVITGHAGSIRCVCIMEKQGLVLSGSYDTSIRMWSVNTGHCLKIFRGHRDTVLVIRVLGNILISGSKDKSCKIWNMSTGKCQRSFRHRHPVSAVAMSTETVITGCEGGKIKVWDLRTGNLIKVLIGHHEGVTGIQFDRYHIVSVGKDKYALVWSAIGDHNRCLTALRHPKEVLCVEFMYLRCITGSADGRIRIWNIINGNCCRIMRGNSRSDPILHIVAIDNRITINTAVNMLVLNFEEVEWDYNLEDDKVPPLVQYSSYAEAPVRQQPYPYIRAQRMKKAGATNTKLLHKDEFTEAQGKLPIPQTLYRATQLPHSAKTLSAKSLESAKMIQSVPTESHASSYREVREQRSAGTYVDQVTSSGPRVQTQSSHSKPPLPSSSKSRPLTSKSGQSGYSVTIMDDAVAEQELDEHEWREPYRLQRRISWAFEHPLMPKSKEISLSETKALLRSQMRMKSESIVPPDFIYLTVNAIQNSMKPSDVSTNTSQNMMDSRKTRMMDTRLRQNRPSSSPSKIDPRTRVPVEQLDLSQFREKQPEPETMSEVSEVRSVKSAKSKEEIPQTTDREVFATKCLVKPVKSTPKLSVHPKRIRTTLPKGRVIRPISASVTRLEPPEPDSKPVRPITAPQMRGRPDTASSIPSQIAASMPGVQPHRKKAPNVTTTGFEPNIVPMLMYPPDMKEKLTSMLKEKRQQRHDDLIESASEIGIGKVSQYNDPMRSHVKFELRTHVQEQEFITRTEQLHHERQKRDEVLMERKKRLLWTAKATGRNVWSSPSSSDLNSK